MNIHNLFDNLDDKTIDIITEKYPYLESDDKERLYAMSKKKYDNTQTENINVYTEEMGVERYRKPFAARFAGVAAAVLAVTLVIGGGAMLLGQDNGNIGPMTDAVDSDPVSEEATEGTEPTEAEAPEVEYDYEAIATQLFDDYMELEKILQFGDVAYDENDSISFFAYDSADLEWTSEHGGERKYYKVTDERFSCCQDIYEMVRAVTTDTLSPDTNYDSKDVKWFEGAHLASWLGGDVSGLEAGSKIDLAYVDESDESLRDEFEAYLSALRVNNAVFIEYNGELYVKPRVHDFIEYTNDAVVKEIGENGFTAARYLNDCGSYMNYGNQIILEIVSEDGEWQINSRKTGAMVEYFSSIGIRNYLWNKPEYYDIELLDIIEYLEVTDYDEETLSCKVHGILPDINGEDAIEITAEVIISPAISTGAVKSADIVRLNEYDGTLVRPEVLLRDDYSPLN